MPETKFPWKQEYSVQVEELDQQHQKFLQVMGELYKSILDNQGEKEKIFQGLEDYATTHFSTEEKYFDLYCYEDTEKHKAEHREFIKKMDEFKKQENISFELLDFLEDWLVSHLASFDQKYVPCLKEHGLK